MPAVRPVEIPAPSTWSRVLRRYDRDPRLPLVFAGYDCRVVAKPVDVGGVVAPTLFFPLGKEEGAKRAIRLGWIDETDKVRAFSSQFVVITGPALAAARLAPDRGPAFAALEAALAPPLPHVILHTSRLLHTDALGNLAPLDSARIAERWWFA